MAPKVYEIQLHGPPVLFPGALFQGQVYLETEETYKNRGIRLVIEGTEHTRWSTGS
jgi:hypothetical protein